MDDFQHPEVLEDVADDTPTLDSNPQTPCRSLVIVKEQTYSPPIAKLFLPSSWSDTEDSGAGSEVDELDDDEDDVDISLFSVVVDVFCPKPSETVCARLPFTMLPWWPR